MKFRIGDKVTHKEFGEGWIYRLNMSGLVVSFEQYTDVMCVPEYELKKIGDDIHTITAMAMFVTNYNEVTEDMRQEAKNRNFWPLYGGSGRSVSSKPNFKEIVREDKVPMHFNNKCSKESKMKREVFDPTVTMDFIVLRKVKSLKELEEDNLYNLYRAENHEDGEINIRSVHPSIEVENARELVKDEQLFIVDGPRSKKIK